MSEQVYICFDLPTKAVEKPEVKKLLKSLEFFNYEDVSEFNWPDNKDIKSFEFYDSSNFMSGRNSIVKSLIAGNIPFDLVEGAHSEQMERHIFFRDGMTKPYEYFGETPSVSVNEIRNIIGSDLDYAGERIVEYLDMNFPEIESLEDAVAKWDTRGFSNPKDTKKDTTKSISGR